VGYCCIQGELLKLSGRCSHGTGRNVLRHHGLLAAPRRGQRSWREFVDQHADQMVGVDFFTVQTVRLQRLHVLFLLEIGSRWRPCSPAAPPHLPAPGWSSRPGQLAWLAQDGKIRAATCSAIVRQVHRCFDEVFRSEGVEVIRLPHRSRRANSFAERWVRTARREVLDHPLIFSCRHREHVLGECASTTRRRGRTRGWSGVRLGNMNRPQPRRLGRCSAVIAWVACFTSTSARQPDAPIGLLERGTPRSPGKRLARGPSRCSGRASSCRRRQPCAQRRPARPTRSR
jgi:hypothetical protein